MSKPEASYSEPGICAKQGPSVGAEEGESGARHSEPSVFSTDCRAQGSRLVQPLRDVSCLFEVSFDRVLRVDDGILEARGTRLAVVPLRELLRRVAGALKGERVQ